jgi:hypothetical protein
MTTQETAAQELADALASGHTALSNVTAKMRAFVSGPIGIVTGPLTRETFILEARAVEAKLNRLHLDITPFDPRPQPRDGGGK